MSKISDAWKQLSLTQRQRFEQATGVQAAPLLTDAEREAVEAAARIIDAYDEEMDGYPSGASATLRGLLARCATGSE